jgi:hypothetical protein
MSITPDEPTDIELKPAGVWPPPPTKQKAPPVARGEGGELTHCPHCRNRLLTHRSVMCNWCGKPINDKEYLEKAASERAAADAAMRDSLARAAQKPQKKLGIIGRITRKANQLMQNDDF